MSMKVAPRLKSRPKRYRRFTSRTLAIPRFVVQRMMLKPLVWSLTRVDVRTEADLRRLRGAFLVVANHASHLDTPLVLGSLPRRLSRYLAAGAAADYFFEVRWRKWLTSLVFNTFPVDRTGARAHSGVSKRLLARGVPLLIFPEGGRSASGRIGAFKPGAAALAIACDVPCVPVAICGAHEAMPRGQWWPVRGRPPVTVRIGAPIWPRPGESATAFTERLATEVRRLHAMNDSDEPADRPRSSKGDGMTEVRHMKWWGWGNEGVAFEYRDKPDFAPFVQQAIGLDVTAPGVSVPEFDSLEVPESRLDDEFRTELEQIVGADHVQVDAMSRVVHTFGKSIRDLLRVRSGSLERTPDVVVYPGDEDQVQRLVHAAVAADCVVIPFGGGSNIAGSLEPAPDEERVVISLDMGRMNRVLEIDEESGLARIEAGALGPDLERELGKRGWTMGHFPDSFTHSTLGGWIATRSSGMQSDKYGDIADIVRGVRVARPGGVVEIRAIPSASTGPSVREMIVGSEGRLGVITEATMHVHRVPEVREILGYFFPNWKAGLAAMREIAESDASPTVTRVSDAPESAFSFATRKESKGIEAAGANALMRVLKARGWDLDQICLSFIGYEGSASHVRYEKKLVRKIVRRHGGFSVGKSPGRLYDQKKFDTPYIRDFLLDRGAAGDVSETAAPWSKLEHLYEHTIASARKAYDDIGVQGWIMCHLSHSYHAGACLYFTFAFMHGDEPLKQYDHVKSAIQQAFIDAGGTLSHHHAVGVEHAPWLSQDISPEGVALMQGLFDSADPKRNFNPDKIIPRS
ncbi:FAD-linked oxidase C-terminal domain-containing protein [Phytoactinopolyspora halotolerans]|uniref:FAD-binding protein n=1 Tax=Phytoactinopolyspora halotolerans TaxID=1981512 RepID=A0A6L9SD87_9ACTN|nr:FAD-linked oxidase C-terminal domain-containing protein [Phytoactinopolyspora halotolerans]NEE03216.1 FAD-binding protein [Phytoactinopolyspora halotolerans]